MSPNECRGNPTFNLIYNGAFSEWPQNLPGFVCKTPPIGHNSASRFAECCSGTVYNITSPTSPDHPAYPVSCAMVCQVDPAFNNSGNKKNPYGWSDQFMCLLDGDIGGESPGWEVDCDTITVPGVPAPTSFASTPSGSWMTKSYALDDHQFPILDSWGNPIPLPTTAPISYNVWSGHATPTAGLDDDVTTATTESASESTPASTSPTSPESSGTAAATSTPPSKGAKLSLPNLAATLLAVTVLCAGL